MTMTAAQLTAHFSRAILRQGDPGWPGSSACRRFLDVVVASSALVFLLPVMLCIAVANYLESGFPIFFSQTRLGQGGRHFRLLKFRKFAPSEGAAGLGVTLADDARLTRVGRILEKTKLDELPQFWNVIKGDMSLVGPRPESLKFEDCFVGSFRALLEHKPGIFGPAQVRFRNENAHYCSDEHPEQTYRRLLFPTKASLDLLYYDSRTLLRDIAWIGRGVAAVAGPSGIRRQTKPMRPKEGVSFIEQQQHRQTIAASLGIVTVVGEDNNGL
jgi:lipopolysaccharide/colanic/teichoic acid biosynthesis glycosyltransferase